ncbi:TIR domain-containing protein [Staphylococcus sp. mip270_02]|uniref:TIR domain-containing protein n=1 Tax=Staphylococcus TaxID=1279 RepID=UPI00157BED0F|nr:MULTISPECIES: TIR domain-containing protein [Staphylococcus]MBG3873568.1 TIR domain-containing protein [Staphylococcus xylosus]MDW4038670.1 TIR domain-containing protein [Staphylococcus saprophyticus]MDW4088938.1 TIR domain-containing protein [Staphylococcus saprophyticus]MDW4108969.1 TIR domain-containing protein [Staphylococcus saprophyticus]MDW4207242.1 TIR domain-containing protein [Staphylococcus saprophyticus]
MLGKLFVSYRADAEGSRYKNLFVGWSENPNKSFFDVKFVDTSVGISIKSDDAYYIKARIKEKIKSSDKVICIIGENTHTSDWVNWEIDTAKELNKPIVAIKINRLYHTPTRLYNNDVKWAYSFNYEAIKKALLEV